MMLSKGLLVAAITLLMCANGVLSHSCKGMSKRLLGLVSTMHGFYFGEIPKSWQPTTTTQFIQEYFQALQIPNLFGVVEVYHRSRTSSSILREEVWSFAEPIKGRIVGRIYKVVNNRENPGDLTASDLELLPEECKMFFRRVEPAVFAGTRPNCKEFINNGGDVDRYYPLETMVFTWDGLVIVNADEKPLKDQTTRLPAVYQKFDIWGPSGDSMPLICDP